MAVVLLEADAAGQLRRCLFGRVHALESRIERVGHPVASHFHGMSTSYTRLARPDAKPTVCLSRVEKSTQLPFLALRRMLQPWAHLPLQWRHAEESKFLDYVLQDYPLGNSCSFGAGHCGIAAQTHAAHSASSARNRE